MEKDASYIYWTLYKDYILHIITVPGVGKTTELPSFVGHYNREWELWIKLLGSVFSFISVTSPAARTEGNSTPDGTAVCPSPIWKSPEELKTSP